MTSSATPLSTSPVESLEDLETLFALMRSFRVGIVELPGGFKVVLEPEMAQPAAQRGHAVPDMPAPRSIHDDPFLYPDGEVPTFGQR
jgi:hypothetical protein